MAMPCGHWTETTEARAVWLVEQEVCPPCGRTLVMTTHWVKPYGQCPCCGERWLVEHGEVRSVIFT